MPDIDGLETAALIRQYSRSAQTPIIFITAYADEIQTARGYSLGAVDYILSPVVPEVLRTKVSVFVSLYLMQRQVQRQADARAAMMAADAARRVAEESDRRSAFLAHASQVLKRVAGDRRGDARQLVELLVPAVGAVCRRAALDRGLLAVQGGGRCASAIGRSADRFEDRWGARRCCWSLRSAAPSKQRSFVALAPRVAGRLDAGSLGLAGSAASLPPIRWRGRDALDASATRVLGALLVASSGMMPASG